MKKNDVRTGARYLAKVSGAVVPVEIVQERWVGDQHKGWIGKNTESGRSVVIKSAQRLRAAVGEGAPKATKIEPAVGHDAGDVGLSGAGDTPVGTSPIAASPVPPKGGKAGNGKKAAKATGGQPAKGKAKSAKAPKPAKAPKKDKPMSCLDAAAKVLADAKEPMRVKDIIEQAAKRGLWKSKAGKTPQATAYAAIVREIRDRGVDSRFEKKDRGLFIAAGK